MHRSVEVTELSTNKQHHLLLLRVCVREKDPGRDAGGREEGDPLDLKM
jgi:hypothetical protein